ncbi:MAG TPA: NAD+ synthase [Paracoccaceae bacterium]|nr:NAD+ synthase [Paracoccaceae bacterium]
MSEPDRLRVMIVQENAIAGDLEANSRMALAALDLGAEAGADLVVLPEMFLSGYPLGDLAVRPAFLRDCRAAIEALAKATKAGGPALAIGAPADASDEPADGADGDEAHAYNALMLLQDGAIRACFKKHDRPNSGVFDEKRLFREGPAPGPIEIAGCRIGFPIGEDISGADVAETLEESGAELLIVPAAMPYARGQHDRRIQHAIARVIETGLPLIQLNTIGGQDDLVFDGGSFALNPGGQLAAQLPFFDRHVCTLDIERAEDGWRIMPSELATTPGETALDYRAMVEALRDYVGKSGFERVLLGLSGGIDSSIVATLAVDALGAANVSCVWLPSRYSSIQSERDAAEQARLLGVQLDTVPIEIPVAAVETSLSPLFAGLAPDLTEENIQSRLRGLILMALSNKFGKLLLTTGNKSEAAVGYATIYGDMNGAYNPIKDLYKTRVFECCRWRNAEHHPWMRGPAGAVIPLNVLQKPPSAELRPDQRDEDSLPPYPVLDRILQMLIEEERSTAEIVAAGFEREVVMQVQELVYRSEYKRFQSAPGVKLTPRALSRDRRYPLVNRWRDRS